tara:strand:+ start:126 stop:548 length:423 start_codon:yes stop_codon:yes gene_type:complete
MSSFLSYITKLNESIQDDLQTGATILTPDYITTDIKQLSVDNITVIYYFAICLTIILVGVQLGLSNQSVSFLTLGIVYAMITVSLSSKSLFFLLLEILVCVCIIELITQIGLNNFAWVLVFCLPMITIAQSIYFLLFYLS